MSVPLRPDCPCPQGSRLGAASRVSLLSFPLREKSKKKKKKQEKQVKGKAEKKGSTSKSSSSTKSPAKNVNESFKSKEFVSSDESSSAESKKEVRAWDRVEGCPGEHLWEESSFPLEPSGASCQVSLDGSGLYVCYRIPQGEGRGRGMGDVSLTASSADLLNP